MKREGHQDVMYFVGPEVEHTPAYSKKTLFVVGKQPIDEIVDLARQHKAAHIFMGANHSFNAENNDTYWDVVITALLDRGFWVSLDYEAHQHGMVLEMLNKGIWQSRLFVPLLSVRIPNVQTSSPNLTIKIDDVDFKATNAGVWCLHHHEITDSNRFTDWVEYGTDVVIELDDKPTPMPPYVATVVKEMTKPVNLEDLVVVDPGITGWTGGLRVPVPQNNETAGLDPDAKSSLKDDSGVVIAKVTPKSAAEAAEAYAEGAKEDPLSAEGSKKPTKAKK